MSFRECYLGISLAIPHNNRSISMSRPLSKNAVAQHSQYCLNSKPPHTNSYRCATRVIFFFLPSDVPLLRVCISALPVLSAEELQGCLLTLYPQESVSVHKVGPKSSKFRQLTVRNHSAWLIDLLRYAALRNGKRKSEIQRS